MSTTLFEDNSCHAHMRGRKEKRKGGMEKQQSTYYDQSSHLEYFEELVKEAWPLGYHQSCPWLASQLLWCYTWRYHLQPQPYFVLSYQNTTHMACIYSLNSQISTVGAVQENEWVCWQDKRAIAKEKSHIFQKHLTKFEYLGNDACCLSGGVTVPAFP